MKNFFTLLALLASILAFSQSDPSWKVLHNSKVLLQASEEAPDKNVVVIKRSSLAGTGALQMIYQPAGDTKGWERTITIMSEADAEIQTFKGNAVKLSNAALRTMAKRGQRLMIYTISLPKDPKQRALVRVRRMHLCTIEIKG